MIAALRPHLFSFLALLGLLALTAICAGLPLGVVNFPLSLAIATAKALLVALFFMELNRSSMLVRFAACVGILWLAILLMLALADYFTRFPGAS
jgi:cytochrome c oxidase subunit 4